jgi:hypothetical protein
MDKYNSACSILITSDNWLECLNLCFGIYCIIWYEKIISYSYLLLRISQNKKKMLKLNRMYDSVMIIHCACRSEDDVKKGRVRTILCNT